MAPNVIKKHFSYTIEWEREQSDYLNREGNDGTISSRDITESCISWSTSNSMQDDMPAFSLVLISSLRLDRFMRPNDLIKIRVSDAKKDFSSPYVMIGMIGEVIKVGEYSDDRIIYQVSGAGAFSKAITSFNLGMINEVSTISPEVGWLPDTAEDGIQFSGNTASDIARDLVEKFLLEYARYSFSNGQELEDIISYNFDSWTEDEFLTDPTPFINYDGSMHEFLSDIKPPVFCEFVTDFRREGKSVFQMRRTPFDPTDWLALPTVTFKSDTVVDENLGMTDQEMYSVFVVQPQNLHDINSMDLGVFPRFHESFIDKYGYKRLDVQNRYLLSTGVGGIESNGEDSDTDSETEEGEEESTETEEPTEEMINDASQFNGMKVLRDIFLQQLEADEPRVEGLIETANELAAARLRTRISRGVTEDKSFYQSIWGQTPTSYNGIRDGNVPYTYISGYNNKLHLPESLGDGRLGYTDHYLAKITDETNQGDFSGGEVVEETDNFKMVIIPHNDERIKTITERSGGQVATTDEEVTESIDSGQYPTFNEVESFFTLGGWEEEDFRTNSNEIKGEMQSQFEGLEESAIDAILSAKGSGDYTNDKHIEILRESGASQEQLDALEERAVSTEKLKAYTERLYNWNQNNANFRQGEIRVIGNPDYKVGYRLFYEDNQYNTTWEFYVESVKHEFSLSNGFTTVLGVTRGLPDGGRQRFLGLWGQSEEFLGGYLGEPTLADTFQKSLDAVNTTVAGGEVDSIGIGTPTGQMGDIVSYARSIANKPSTYVWGGGRKSSSPLKDSHVRVDCSSFVWWAFKDNGVQLGGSPTGMSTRTIRADSQLQTVSSRGSNKRDALSKAQPGDLIFWDTGGRTDGHVGIYLGNNNWVGAQSSTGVSEAKTGPGDGFWWNSFKGHIKRYPSRGVSSQVGQMQMN